MKPKNKGGRPPLPKEEVKITKTIRLSPQQVAFIEAQQGAAFNEKLRVVLDFAEMQVLLLQISM